MLALDDRLMLVGGVLVDRRELTDLVQQRTWPMNSSAEIVVAGALAGEPLTWAVERIVAVHAVPHEIAQRDVLMFAWALNRRFLANVRPARGYLWRRLRLTLRLLPVGVVLPARVVRHDLPVEPVLRRTTRVLGALGQRAMVATIATGLPLSQALGVGPVAGAVAAATGAGLALHELGHALALGRRPGAIVLSGLRTFVLHAALPTRARRCVALAGPGLVAGAGLVVATCAGSVGSLPLAFGGCAWLSHALGLTVITRDGRNAC